VLGIRETVAALAALPEWLLLGLALGVVCSVAVASVFLLGERLSPPPAGRRSPDSTGQSRRRREIRNYLRAIDEPFAENHSVQGETVAFYLPRRDVAITFDPRAYYRIDSSPTDAVLVEHEMPGVHVGRRLPFETPDVGVGTASGDGTGGANDAGTGSGVDAGSGPGPGATGDPHEEAFAILGLPSDAPPQAVKAAYRERLKEVHPDHGGDEEEFRRLREAYATARTVAS
jgi:hypothetical protein